MRFFVCWALLCVLTVPGLPARAGGEYEARVVVGDGAHPARVFDARLFSGNLEWTRNGSSLLDANPAQYRQSVAALRGLGHPVVRFPGGRLASTYRWKDGVGQARGTGLDFNNKPERMRFGTDEFLALLGDIDAQGMLTVNLNIEPDEVADWLRHVMRQAEAGSAPVPPVPYWEVGNESYLKHDPSYMSATRYADIFTAMRAALKAVDPAVRVGAILEANFIDFPWVKPLIPQQKEWNDTVLGATGGLADFYSIHLYGPYGTSKNEAATRQAVLAVPGVFAMKLAALRVEMLKRGITAPLFVTEYNILTDSIEGNWTYSLDPIQAVYIMDTLLVFAAAGVEAACYWASLDAYNFGLLENTQTLAPRPAVAVFDRLGAFKNAALLDTTVDAPMLQLETIGLVTHLERERIPALNALCLRQVDGTRVVLVVNRSTSEAAVLDIRAGAHVLAPLAVDTVTHGARAALHNGRVHIPPATGAIIRFAP